MIRPKRISENLSVGSSTRRLASLVGEAGGSTDVIVASIAYFSSSVTVQPSFGLKLLIPAAIFAVSGPRSFW